MTVRSMEHQLLVERIIREQIAAGPSCTLHTSGNRAVLCWLRHPSSDARCPVGRLLSDDEYDSTLEMRVVDDVYPLCPSLHVLDLDTLRNLQDAHDLACDDAFMPKQVLTSLTGATTVINASGMEVPESSYKAPDWDASFVYRCKQLKLVPQHFWL